MNNYFVSNPRKMELNQLYFFTATILGWKNLLSPDKYKDIIIQSLQYLSEKQKLKVYAFVIMPNHIHLIWELLSKNGKEMPHASFMKFTSHQFLKDLRICHPKVLPHFVAKDQGRFYQFWQRNSLPVWLYTTEVIEQKLDYIHENPIQEKWSLATETKHYHYSSARFYEDEGNNFGFLHHYKDRI